MKTKTKTGIFKQSLNLLSWTFMIFTDIFLMFKSFHLDVSDFGFLSLCSFNIKNHSQCQFYLWLQNYNILKMTRSFRVKLTFRSNFLYGKDKMKENQTLIHWNERFWTLKIYAKVTKVQKVSKIFLFIYLRI